MSSSDEIEKKVFKEALEARTRSYSPYSKFKVGAALFDKNANEIYSGCNVENASYGAGTCAERAALYAARSTNENLNPSLWVVVTDQENPAVPCGICLQAMAEFCGDDTQVCIANLKGVQARYQFSELLPKAFRSFKVNP